MHTNSHTQNLAASHTHMHTHTRTHAHTHGSMLCALGDSARRILRTLVPCTERGRDRRRAPRALGSARERPPVEARHCHGRLQKPDTALPGCGFQRRGLADDEARCVRPCLRVCALHAARCEPTRLRHLRTSADRIGRLHACVRPSHSRRQRSAPISAPNADRTTQAHSGATPRPRRAKQQMWAGRAQSRCRCGRGEPSRGAAPIAAERRGSGWIAWGLGGGVPRADRLGASGSPSTSASSSCGCAAPIFARARARPITLAHTHAQTHMQAHACARAHAQSRALMHTSTHMRACTNAHKHTRSHTHTHARAHARALTRTHNTCLCDKVCGAQSYEFLPRVVLPARDATEDGKLHAQDVLPNGLNRICAALLLWIGCVGVIERWLAMPVGAPAAWLAAPGPQASGSS
jgi:hypothetical protein